MFKSIILLSILLVTLVTSQPSGVCNVFTCSPEGGKCNNDYYGYSGPIFSPTFNYQDGKVNFCNTGFYCNGDGICSKLGSEGDLCPVTIRGCPGGLCSGYSYGCETGLTCYSGENGPSTCQNLQYATVGESCDSDLQCAYPLKCDLEENICAVNTTLFGSDFECSNDIECPSGKYCKIADDEQSSLCLPSIAIGGDCVRDSQCAQNALCNVDKCTKYFFQSESDMCSGNMACSIGSNLYCDINNKCAQISDLVSGNCTSSSNSCANDYQMCKCGGSSGTCTSTWYEKPSNCQTSFSTYLQCLVDNSCPGINSGVYYQSSRSCSINKCSAEYCNVISSCQSNQISTCNTDVLASTVCTSTSGSSTLSSSIAIIFLALFVIFYII